MKNTSGKAMRENVNMQTNRFAVISYNQYESREAAKPQCGRLLENRETPYSEGSKRLHKHSV